MGGHSCLGATIVAITSDKLTSLSDKAFREIDHNHISQHASTFTSVYDKVDLLI